MLSIGVRRALCVVLLLVSTTARADRPVLHEYVPEVDPEEAVRVLSEVDASPGAIVYQGQALPAPTRDAASNAPPMVASKGDGEFGEQPGQRSPSFRPDRQTELEAPLDYYESFNPSIAPFKRVTSLDAVLLGADGRTPVLGVHDATRRGVPVEPANAPPPDPRPRDRFWGQVELDFSKGRVLPLPSVSPESRILSVRSEPDTELAIERDAAGNFYVEPKGALSKPQVFLAFLTDAPRAYFGTKLPHVPVSALPAPAMDAGVRSRALSFAAQLGLGPSSDFADALSTLTNYFRSFEESAEPPHDTGDIYLDLARAKKGICRHRAYAFVVTAQALGIAARFLQNEAHSWVEVELPRAGFMRIDLGGAAHGLTAHGAKDRPMYQPAEPDPLPRPAAYEASYSQLAQGTKGTRTPELSDLQGRWVSPAAWEAGSHAAQDSSFLGGPDSAAPHDVSHRAALSITLATQHSNVLRGSELRVEGSVRAAKGRGISGLRIEVSLAAEGRRERLLLGVTVTGEHGVFGASFGIPPDLDPGDYRLVVVTPGNDAFLPAIAE